MKQENLEEAADKYYPPKTTDLICSPKLVRDAFKDGAKWQAERMYSEEEVDELVNNLIDKFLNYNGSSIDSEKLKWFYQQLKKK